MSTERFKTGYMDGALFDLAEVVREAIKVLRPVAREFDTIVGTGFSGGVLVPILALRLRKKFVLVRKDTDDSHHGSGRLLGELGERWIFVDDFVSTGATRRRVIDKVTTEAGYRHHPTAHVGDYHYGQKHQGFVPVAVGVRIWN